MKLTWLPIFAAILAWPVLSAGDAPASNPASVKAERKFQIVSGPQFGDDIESARQRFLMQYSNQINEIDGDWSADPPTIALTVYTGSANSGYDFLDAAIRSLKQMILDNVEMSRVKWKHELNDLAQQMQELEQRRSALEGKVKLAIGDLMDIQKNAGLSDDDTESPHQLIHTLETQYEAAQIDLVGKTARQQALAEAIAKLSSQADANVKGDPIAQQLQAVVDVKEKELEHMQQLRSQGAVPEAGVDQMAVELAQAKAAVLERREAAAKAAGTDSLEQWNHELMLLSVDISELKARIDVMKKRLDQLSEAVPALERAISAKSATQSMDSIDSEIISISARVDRLRRNLDPANEPKVVVLESTDEPLKSEPPSAK
jgi:hypothetical protein